MRCDVGAILEQVLDHDVNIVHLERPWSEQRTSALAALVAPGPWRREVHVDSRSASIGARPLVPDFASDEARGLLLDEINGWVRAFAWLADVDRVKVTLASVWSDACRRFHSDFVPLRMLCTYVGPATEFVADQDTARDHAIHLIDMDEANAQMIPDPTTIRRCDVGDILVLKGETWPNNRGHGAIHRSPPIEHAARGRLVLTLDVLNPMLGER